MGAFSGTLNRNKIQNAIFNMIISQEVYADNIGKHQTLVDKARVDGGLYGDQKLYYATDVLKSSAWGNDAEATNLLALHRPSAPSVQAIVLDQFRQICLTTDNYLSKQAFSTEGAFSSYTGVMVGWMAQTKKIYEGALYNVFIGTTESSANGQTPTAITLTGTNDGQAIAKAIADLLVKLEDYNRINDYGYLRSYAMGDVKLVWNSNFVNKITKLDLPTVFHKDGLVDKLTDDAIAPRYFGRDVANSDVGNDKVIKANGEVDATKGTVRSRVEKAFTFEGQAVHLFPGDALVSGMKVDATGATVSNPDFDEDEVYIEDAKIICKVIVKMPPMMSAFSVGTSFFNPKSLTENHYLTWGYNTLEYLKNYPFITIKQA